MGGNSLSLRAQYASQNGYPWTPKAVGLDNGEVPMNTRTSLSPNCLFHG